MVKELKEIEIFTDGACRGNPGPGGWGALLRYGNQVKTIKGGEILTTNNRMELIAAIKALEQLKQKCKVTLHTDSQYLRTGMTEWIQKWQSNGWKTSRKKDIKNKELWDKLQQLCDYHSVKWVWVKAHAGHTENEQVDRLANEAIDEMLKKEI